jgi:hypothetical protein
MTEEEGTWVESVVDPAYEICTAYPYQIRKIADGRILKELDNGNGYIRCCLN